MVEFQLVDPGKAADTVPAAAEVLEVEDGETSTVFDKTGCVADVVKAEVEDDPKVEAIMEVEDTAAVGNGTAADDEFPLAGVCCRELAQFLPVGLPQPLPPATGHHSGSGSPDTQSGMGGEVSSSYFGL